MLSVTIKGDTKILGDLRVLVAKAEEPFEQVAEIQTIIATTVRANMDQEVDPDGVPWPPLSQEYADWKSRVAPEAEMGYLFGAMKEEANLRGVATVVDTTMTISYGVDPEAIAHAVKFTFGGLVTGTSQPQRPFWGITTDAVGQLNDYFETRFKP